MTNCNYSVVVPVYNSSKTLLELFDRLFAVFKNIHDGSFELILVEDGSSDNSWEKIQELKRAYPEIIHGIRFARNFGQHNALLCGFRFTKGEFVITMDDDLQTPPEEISKLIQKIKEANADLVYGTYDSKQHSLLRNTGSSFIKKIAPYASGNTNKGSSFRIIRKEIINQIRSYNQPFVFVDEVIFWHTRNITNVEVNHMPRKEGKSGYSFAKLVGLTFNLVINYSNLPLRIMTVIGFLSSFFAFLFGVFFIWKKVHYKVPIGYTSIIVTIFFSTGIILFCMGIVGEYISRIYNTQNNKPQYSIKEHI